MSASARDWSADWLAPVTLTETSLVPAAACWTLRAISRVAESCSSTAAAMVVAMPLISRMVSLMPPIAVTQSPVADWIAVTCPAISSVAFAVWLASSLTSDATTAKPAAGLAGARGLDGRVQRQQIGLAGDRADQAQHVADLLGGRGQAAHHLGGLSGLDHGALGDLAGMGDLPADLGDGGSEFFGRGGNRADAGGCLVRTRPRAAARCEVPLTLVVISPATRCMSGCCLCDRGDDALDVGSRSGRPSARCKAFFSSSACCLAASCVSRMLRDSIMLRRNTSTAPAMVPSSSRALAAGDRDVDLAARQAVHDAR